MCPINRIAEGGDAAEQPVAADSLRWRFASG